ncbi:hypothetical protein [Ferrovibrio sp.]|uniref:hypothetical protein n=1 Tax=Ferrovibrio sp. TaxID=1917215 RepID=UPI003D2B4937
MRSVARGIVAALLLAVLSACGGAKPPQAEAVSAPQPAPSPADTLNLALVPPPSVPGEAPRRAVSSDAIGKNATELRALFGQPAQLRREAPAEVWQYLAETPACVLLFVLYPTETPGVQRVQHAEALPRRRGSQISDADCVAALLKTSPAPGKPVS